MIAHETTRVEDKLVTFSFRPDAGGVYNVMACLFGLNVLASPLCVIVPPNNVKEESNSNNLCAATNEEAKATNISDVKIQESSTIETVHEEIQTLAVCNETKLKRDSQIEEQMITENNETVTDVSVSVSVHEDVALLDSNQVEKGKDEVAALDSNHIEGDKDNEESSSKRKRFDVAGDRIAEDTSWKVGDRCIARWEDDGVWYRAEVKEIQRNGVLVSFIDYGNEAIVYKLVNIFLEIPHTDAYDDNVVLTDSPDENQKSQIVETVNIEKQSTTMGSLSVKDDLHKSENDNKAVSAAVNKFSVGDVCIARWDQDRVWYNGAVLNVLGNGSYLVNFIDYGNSEVVNEPFIVDTGANVPEEVPKEQVDSNVSKISQPLIKMSTEITGETEAPKELDTLVAAEENIDLQDRLEIKTDDDKALVDETTTMSSFSLGDDCLAKWDEDNVWYRAIVTSQLSSGSFTVMFTDYGNTATVQQKNLLKNAKELPKDTPRYFLDQHVEFVESNLDHRETEDLDKFENKAEFSVGQVCVARWAQDWVWYNAKIVGNNKDRSYLVEFVDYGNIESVDPLFILEDGSKIPTTVDKYYIDENVDTKSRKTDIDVEHDTSKYLLSSPSIETEISKISKTTVKDDTSVQVDEKDAMDKRMDEDNVKVLSKHTDKKNELEEESVKKMAKIREKSTPAIPRPLKDMTEKSTNNNGKVNETEENSVCDKEEFLSLWHPGDSCLALWSEDLVWYNGVVERRNHNGSYTVTFTDYGNQEDVKPDCIVLDQQALVATGKECRVDVNVEIDQDNISPGSIGEECLEKSIGQVDEDGTSFGFDPKFASCSSPIAGPLTIQGRSMDQTFVETLNILPMVKVSDRGTPILPAKEVLRIDDVKGPIGISVLHNKNIVISSSWDNSVKMFNPSGEMMGLIESKRSFKRPSDMSSLSTGGFVVRDDVGLQMFTEEGVFIKEIGQCEIDKCYGVTQDNEGLVVTINGVRASDHSRPGSKGKGGITDVGETDIFYIDRESGSVVKQIELIDIIQSEDKIKSKCRFINFHQGNVYIVDLGLDCVYILDTNGNQADSFGSSGTGPGKFNDPAGLVVDDVGNMIVADSRNHRLQVFDREGRYVAVVQVDKPFNRPSG